jgi:hypothetical protein
MKNFKEGVGKSSSFFFFTDNKRFVIKTLKTEEKDLLIKKGILYSYASHLNSNPKSLLARFYGVYSIRIKHMEEISVVIMGNLMGDELPNIKRIYDIKGSTLGRVSSEGGPLQVLKDNNFLKNVSDKMALSSQEEEQELL